VRNDVDRQRSGSLLLFSFRTHVVFHDDVVVVVDVEDRSRGRWGDGGRLLLLGPLLAGLGSVDDDVEDELHSVVDHNEHDCHPDERDHPSMPLLHGPLLCDSARRRERCPEEGILHDDPFFLLLTCALPR
jgi:hypothetical protein